MVIKRAHIFITRALEFFEKYCTSDRDIKCGIPSEPTTNYVTTVSIIYELGTVSDLQFVDESINTKGSDEFR